LFASAAGRAPSETLDADEVRARECRRLFGVAALSRRRSQTCGWLRRRPCGEQWRRLQSTFTNQPTCKLFAPLYEGARRQGRRPRGGTVPESDVALMQFCYPTCSALCTGGLVRQRGLGADQNTGQSPSIHRCPASSATTNTWRYPPTGRKT
jgi:hypothetical protein